MKTSRRKFVKIASVTGAGMISGALDSFNSPVGDIRFLSPVDGDMLCEYDGTVTNKSLLTSVKILAPAGSKIKVNGDDAKYSNTIFLADVRLKDYKNIIELTDGITGNRQSITVYWLRNYINKYRLSLDDNILFLKDISDNAGRYKSIFENQYLGFLKHVHDTFGTKIHLNIYYQTEGFNLSQMTTKYKNEWKENAGWLRLSFHALQNEPDKPYINAGYDEVKRDCEKVKEQIRRFAGEELMGPVTTLHWGEATVEGCRALRDSGYTGLAGYFVVDETKFPVSYYLNMEQRRNLNKRFIWKDNREGIIFGRISIVINSYDLSRIVPYLEDLKKNQHKPGFLDLMIHEQYFHPSYIAYQPDYRQKVLTSVKWAVENGYKPAFFSECIYE
jgi:hypothetical protein